jgi:hypothetical protein
MNLLQAIEACSKIRPRSKKQTVSGDAKSQATASTINQLQGKDLDLERLVGTLLIQSFASTLQLYYQTFIGSRHCHCNCVEFLVILFVVDHVV